VRVESAGALPEPVREAREREKEEGCSVRVSERWMMPTLARRAGVVEAVGVGGVAGEVCAKSGREVVTVAAASSIAASARFMNSPQENIRAGARDR
jgi:hypothetical protein